MTQTPKTFTRARDARRAARLAGMAEADIVTHETETGRFYCSAKPALEQPTRRAKKAAPDGKLGEIIALCRREEGATRADLLALTGWTKNCSWRWLLSNPRGSGLCDRYGYQLEVVKSGHNSQYFIRG